MNTPRPNPARFDGHWLRPRQMADLLGIGTGRLRDLADAMPEAATRQPGGYGRAREYDAGAVLRWRQDHADRRHRP